MYAENYWKIGVLVLFLFLSAMFSASETALTSLNNIRVQQMTEDKVKGIERVNKLLSDPNKLLSSILIGNNVVNIAASSLMTSLAIELFGNTGVGIATGIMTLLILIFAEITPKSLAAQNAESIALSLSGFVYVNMLVVTPISMILSKITGRLIKILGGDVEEDRKYITHEELKTIVRVSHKEGVLEGEEKDMIQNVFDFRDSHASDVMIPRADMVAIDINLPQQEIIDIISGKKYSRIPVYDGNVDNIIGILHLKDLIFLRRDDFTTMNFRNYLSKPHFTYSFKPIKDLFQKMKKDRIHMAIVIDEYGGTEGIVTLEDLIEQIVGNIEDEYDSFIRQVEKISETEYLVDGNIKIEEINSLLKVELESDDYDTIAGFVIGLINRFPDLHEKIPYQNLVFTAEHIEKNRIDKVRITKREKIEE